MGGESWEGMILRKNDVDTVSIRKRTGKCHEVVSMWGTYRRVKSSWMFHSNVPIQSHSFAGNFIQPTYA